MHDTSRAAVICLAALLIGAVFGWYFRDARAVKQEAERDRRIAALRDSVALSNAAMALAEKKAAELQARFDTLVLADQPETVYVKSREKWRYAHTDSLVLFLTQRPDSIWGRWYPGKQE